MKYLRITISIMVMTIFSISLFAQDQFVRGVQINAPDTYASGFGSTVSGVDLDNDGKVEIYSVDGMSDFMTGDEIPQIIKYEFNGTSWDSVWAASFPNERQNSWAALTVGDLDGDTKQEIIWGFTNNFAVNTTPPRIVVFEANGDDILGVSDGAGNFGPNAQWNFDLDPSFNVRPLKWFANDIDGDGKQEVIFAGRQNTITFGVISVDDIPDAAGGTETWTMEINNSTELYDRFTRSAVIDGPDGGFGGFVTGVDYDADGLMDLYAVNDDWSDGANGELIPKLYKYELVSGAWLLRWSTQIPGMDFQNSWPVLLNGDWDNDGKGEVIWCPVNNFGPNGENPDPDRIVVYETPGDGSDVMGIDNGDGNYAPNAGWNMDVPASTSMRPFRGALADVDGDGNLEFIFAERHNYYVWGVVGVSDIPDAGDGSETWTMKANGVPDAGNDYRDLTVIDQNIYLFSSNGNVRIITNDGTNFAVGATHKSYPGWSWLSATPVDIDGDGTIEIVTGDYLSSGTGSVWVLVEDADTLKGYKIADFSANANKQITNVRAGDIDGDGMMDFAVGFRGTDAVYRVAYNGGDIAQEASYVTSLLDKGVLGLEGVGQMDMMAVVDIDGKGGDEVFYTGVPRGLDANTSPLTVGSYADTLKLDGGSRWDIAIANNSINLFDGSGNVQRVDYSNDQWNIYPTQPAVVNGAFLTASTTDVDGDGTEEIMVGNWYDAKVNMMKWENGAWAAYQVADFTAEGGNRLNGGAVGDIDNDGNIDFVTGTRESAPIGQIFRVKYTGGDITDAASWKGEVIDKELDVKFTQYEVINIANLDNDPEMEVLYTSDYARGDNTDDDPTVPIVILDIIKVETTSIADVKVDSDGDFAPDNLGQSFTIQGVVTTPDFNLSNASMSLYVQDETGGINVFASAKPTVVPAVGDLVQITGTVDLYNGLTELVVTEADVNIIKLGLGTVPDPKVISVNDFITNGEMYEGMLVKINGIKLSSGTWPAENSNSNLIFTDGYKEFTVRVDKDVDIDGQAEPGYPVNIIGVGSQFDSNTPASGGYQLFPRYYTDIKQNVQAAPSAYFFFTEESKTNQDTTYTIEGELTAEVSLSWNPSVDLNDDALIYQVAIVRASDGQVIEESLSDGDGTLTSTTRTHQQLIDLINQFGENGSFTGSWVVRVSDLIFDPVASVDTLKNLTLVDMITGVESQTIPSVFYVDQNYPNPFNPTTTINFGLPSESVVDLRIYDILGREVATLVNNRSLKAGVHNYVFDASKLASGTYIYRLTTNNNVISKKMLLLK